MEPGFGIRHPAIDSLMATSPPAVAVEEASWFDGAMPLRISAHLGQRELPELLVSSVRCIVHVDDEIVVCTTPDGADPWPGGRREHGESYWQTARREVYEETGWLVRPDAFEMLGWLHFECLRALPDDHPYPHPDFLQVVYTAVAEQRATPVEATWVAADEWVQSSRLVAPAVAEKVVTAPCATPFLQALAQ
jgi:8-oxo-dGTP pyrophosphatase MutT (NUDIX family)